MKYPIAALLLAVSGFANACTADQIKINVLPFEAQADFSTSYAQLQEIAGSTGNVGLVKARSSVVVDGCTATVGYKAPVLYIASELKRDQCAFEHVLEHENEHLRIYQRALNDLESRIRASAASMTLFDAAVKEVQAVRAVHAAHDSSEEYARNSTACGGQIVRLVRKPRFG